MSVAQNFSQLKMSITYSGRKNENFWKFIFSIFSDFLNTLENSLKYLNPFSEKLPTEI